jgi:hypothetical protein
VFKQLPGALGLTLLLTGMHTLITINRYSVCYTDIFICIIKINVVRRHRRSLAWNCTNVITEGNMVELHPTVAEANNFVLIAFISLIK